ncbi:MAG TPA: T9SS type A sorting domain-containing protein [Bacteroidia bacterium]|nr:T9SS type A sorting domain-containing protein [Bacteroidia bacterium]
MKKITIIMMVLISLSYWASGQTFSINGTTTTGGNIQYCPSIVTIGFTGADTMKVVVVPDSTATNDTIIVLKSPYLFNGSLNAPTPIIILCYKAVTGDTEVDYSALRLTPKKIGTKITATTDSLVCNRTTSITIAPVSDAISTVNWKYGSNTSTSNPLTTIPFSGDSQKYVATILLTDGCTVSDSLELHRKLLKGEVCWVTVDTSSIHNLVVWDTNGISKKGIDSLRLYFYNASNQWQLIGDEAYTDTNRYFVDNLNNPNANTVRYCIATVDSCGDVEPFANSLWHNTMFIANSSGTFSWSGTGYLIEGATQPVLTYYLYRNDTLIDSISGTQNKMTDPNYSTTASYYVGAKLNIDMCALSPLAYSKRPEAMNALMLSHSNIVGKKIITGIAAINGGENVKPYPNPSNGIFNLGFSAVNSPENKTIEVYSILGEKVLAKALNSAPGGNTVDLSSRPNGVYLYRVVTNNGELVGEGKLIIQK